MFWLNYGIDTQNLFIILTSKFYKHENLETKLFNSFLKVKFCKLHICSSDLCITKFSCIHIVGCLYYQSYLEPLNLLFYFNSWLTQNLFIILTYKHENLETKLVIKVIFQGKTSQTTN